MSMKTKSFITKKETKLYNFLNDREYLHGNFSEVVAEDAALFLREALKEQAEKIFKDIDDLLFGDGGNESDTYWNIYDHKYLEVKKKWSTK